MIVNLIFIIAILIFEYAKVGNECTKSCDMSNQRQRLVVMYHTWLGDKGDKHLRHDLCPMKRW